MIVELVGVPAAGKSTLAARLDAVLRQSGADLVVLSGQGPVARRALRRVAVGLSRWQVLLAATTALVFDGRPMRQRVRALRSLLATLEQYAMHDPCQILLLDEGLFQRALLNFFPSSGDVRWSLVNRYIERIPAPALVVRLVVSPSDVLERLERRARERSSDSRRPLRFLESETGSEIALGDADVFLTSVITKLCERRGTRVLEVASDTPISDAVCDQIADAIMTAFPTRDR